MHGYPWDFFPARLHTTKEIVFFLENISNIESVIQNHPADLANVIFGDIYHPEVIGYTKAFLTKGVDRAATDLIIEISSRKISYYGNTPVNYSYARDTFDYVTKYNIIDKKQTDEEIENDLLKIMSLSKTVFNENIRVRVITHINLKNKSTMSYNAERNDLVVLLEHVCAKYNITIYNIGKFIESVDPADGFIEKYMRDLYHLDDRYIPMVHEFLISEIQK